MPGIWFAFVTSIRVARTQWGLEGVRIARDSVRDPVRDPMRRGSRGQKTEEEQPKSAS